MKYIMLLMLCLPVYAVAQKKSPTQTANHTNTAKTEPHKAAPEKTVAELLEGCWTITRNPAFYLHLGKKNKFESNDINRQTHKVTHLTGTWLVAENALVLNYNEISTQRLHFLMNKKVWTIKRHDGADWTKADGAKCQ